VLPLADGLPDALLTPQNLTLVSVLGLIVVGLLRGTIVSGKHHDERIATMNERIAQERLRGDKWEALCLDMYRTAERHREATRDAVKIAEKSLDVVRGQRNNEPPGIE
jgi:hypothetical protein